MITFANLLGIYGTVLFFLGVMSLLYPTVILVVTLLFFLLTLYFLKDSIRVGGRVFIQECKQDKRVLFLVLCFLFLGFVNLIGVLGPELAFDALWYHLTLPKWYLEHHSISYIPGGLLYYSGMPQLTEMYYISVLVLQGEILAKGIHFLFGILCCISLYTFSKRFLSPFLSFLVVLVFYGNLVVAWESITAYVDLSRTFFEFLSFSTLFIFLQTKQKKLLYLSAILLGFAIGVKLLSLGGILLSLGLLAFYGGKEKGKLMLSFVGITILTASPWFIYALFSTGNPLFPLFTSFSEKMLPLLTLLNPLNMIKDVYLLFLHSPDPLSPLYVLVLPLLFLTYKQFTREEKMILVYSIAALIIWYITPRTGGGRFILPYLPVFSLLVGIVLSKLQDRKALFSPLILAILFVFTITIVYRAGANKKYLPVILGNETKEIFLEKNLNFAYGDFFDTDHFFEKTIKEKDVVYLEGFHNLYYVNFPFVLGSKDGSLDKVTYVATQHTSLPPLFSGWSKIYHNKITGVTLYQKP